MGKELSDKQIHELAERTSLGCPNCGRRMTLYCNSNLAREDVLAVCRFIEAGLLRLVPLEDGIEKLKRVGVSPDAKEFMQ